MGNYKYDDYERMKEKKKTKELLVAMFDIKVVKFHDAKAVSHIFVESTFDKFFKKRP